MAEKNESFKTTYDVADDYEAVGQDENEFTSHEPKPDKEVKPPKDEDPDLEHLLKGQRSEEEADEDESESEPELSPSEEKAVANGWMPKEDWEKAGNDPDDWVDARTFNMRGDLLGKVYKERGARQQLQSQVQELQKVIYQLGEHNAKLAQKEISEATRTLRAQRSEAERDEDYQTVAEIDEKLDQLTEAKGQLKEYAAQQPDDKQQQKVPQGLQNFLIEGRQAFADWANENSWFNQDRVMQAAARSIADEVFNENIDADGNPGITPEALLSRVKMRIKQEFPHKFKQQRRSAVVNEPGSGDGKSRTRGTKGKYSERDLSAEQRKMFRAMKQVGTPISASEYARQLAELGELPSQQKR